MDLPVCINRYVLRARATRAMFLGNGFVVLSCKVIRIQRDVLDPNTVQRFQHVSRYTGS